MTKDITKARSNILLGAEWHDSIEACVRMEIRGFIEKMLEAELSTALGRARCVRAPESPAGGAGESGPPDDVDAAVANPVAGHHNRELMGTFSKTTVSVPRARAETAEGGTTEWRSKTLSVYRRRTKEVDALIAGKLSRGHKHAPCRAGGVIVPGRSVEGHGEPRMAEDQRRLGDRGSQAQAHPSSSRDRVRSHIFLCMLAYSVE
jgi:hypothetical protein